MQEGGIQGLTRSTTAWLAGVVFAIAFLGTVAFGGTAMTATTRGAICALATWLFGPFLVRPALVTVLDAIARDRVGNGPKGDT